MTEGGEGAGGQGNTGSGGGEGGNGNEFIQSLPEGVRSHEAISGLENLEGLATGYVDLHGQLAELQGKIPQVPESVDGYQFTPGEEVKVSEERIGAFRAKAHELGLTQAQFEAVVQFDIESSSKSKADLKKQRDDALKAAVEGLKAEWGDKFEENANLADQALEKLTTKEFRELLVQTGLNNNPLVIHTFHRLGTILSEDQFVRAQRAAQKRPTDEGGKPRLKYPSMGDK